MKWSKILVGVILLSVSTGQANAAIWCGQRPGNELNHPCGNSDAHDDRALSNATRKYQEQWRDLKGVWNLKSATSAAGGLMEIQVLVDPAWAGCARSQIPRSANDMPVLIIPSDVPSAIFFANGYAMSLRRPPSRKSNSNLKNEKAYTAIVRVYGQRWLALPGVIGIAPAGCDCSSCGFTGIEISVQRPFMSVLLKQIPPSVGGVPISLLPSD